MKNTITLDGNGNANIVGAGGAYLRYNATSGQYRFRYYKSSTYSSQKAIALYLKDGSAGTTWFTGSPVKCAHSNTTNTAAVAATCTQGGYTAGVYCNTCNSYISGHEEVAALGHDYDEGSYIEMPTCELEGEIEYTCIRCDYLYTELLQPLGHNYVLSGNVYTCSGCGDSYTIPVISFSVPAGVAAVNDALCDANGVEMPGAGAPEGYTFVGWIANELDVTADKPSNIYKAGDRCTVSANATYYALYTYT